MRPRPKPMCRRTSELASNQHLNKTASVLIKRGFFRQFECTKVKFLCRLRLCRVHWRRFDQRKCGVRELLPDGKIIRRNREPPEPEYVTSGLGYMSHLLPGDFIDHQSFCPSENRGRHRSAEQVFGACWPREVLHASAFRKHRAARRTSPARASDYSVLRSGRRPRASWRMLPVVRGALSIAAVRGHPLGRNRGRPRNL